MTKIQQKSELAPKKRNRLKGGWSVIDNITAGLSRKFRLRATFVLGVAIVVAILLISFLSSRFEAVDIRAPLATLILIIFIAALIFSTLIFIEIASLVKHRGIEGPTQRRLITLFVLMALGPTVALAIFSTVTLNFGIDNWFSSRVRTVISDSYETAKTYDDERMQTLMRDGDLVYARYEFFIQSKPARGLNEREVLDFAVTVSGANIVHSFVINSQMNIEARGPGSYRFDYFPPSQDEIERAYRGEVVLIRDPNNNQLRYLRALSVNSNHYLYVTEEVDGRILSLLDQSAKTNQFYKNSEQVRQKLLIYYGLFYLAVSIVILMLAIWAGISFSSIITRPIGRLARAAERISEGDLAARVVDDGSNDEFSLLSRTFNKMAGDVQGNQAELKKAGEASEAERRKFNNVLEGVSAGVMGVDITGRINFINTSARKLLDIDSDLDVLNIQDIAPEFLEAWQQVVEGGDDNVQGQITLLRGGNQETVFLRGTPAGRRKQGNTILSFDVVSDLVQAQRMAAWGDVARRIAHEIKNPLTPIRLSAERLNRRFSKQIDTDNEKFNELTHIIVRQTQDIQRIVDEFARFSRMPEAERKEGDWIKVIKDAMTLQETNVNKVELRYSGADMAKGVFDAAQIGQAFTNLFKNAIESVETRMVREEIKGQIDIKTTLMKNILEIEITDNGMGFPADKVRLFEPYMTLKEAGTGLGLPIVKKIIEDHEGRISLHDRNDQQQGARIQIRVPVVPQ